MRQWTSYANPIEETWRHEMPRNQGEAIPSGELGSALQFDACLFGAEPVAPLAWRLRQHVLNDRRPLLGIHTHTSPSQSPRSRIAIRMEPTTSA